jgi:hypothetical protein
MRETDEGRNTFKTTKTSAPPLLLHNDLLWLLGQSGPKSEASKTVKLSVELAVELSEVTATGGINRCWPVGGWAKGIPRYADTSDRTREAAPLTVPAFTVTGWPTVHGVCRGFVFGPPPTGKVKLRPASAGSRMRSELKAVMLILL